VQLLREGRLAGGSDDEATLARPCDNNAPVLRPLDSGDGDASGEHAPLAEALAEVGRHVRDAVRAVAVTPEDHAVARIAGGDVVFGVDARADTVLVDALRTQCGARWPGRLVIEGFDDDVRIGEQADRGPWVYLADPVDGTRPWLAGKRSAWVLLGAGRDARTLDDLTVGAAVELPTARARLGRVAWATTADDRAHAVDDDLVDPSTEPTSATLQPRTSADLQRTFVTVARLAPGQKGEIGRWEDAVLAGLETYEDPWLCTGGQLMGLATGADAAVLDPRPRFGASLCAHPYDLAAIVVARAAGVIVEGLPPGPLDVPIATDFDVAWAGYANAAIAAELRDRMRRADADAATPPSPRRSTPG
jgi:hypothetical protein